MYLVIGSRTKRSVYRLKEWVQELRVNIDNWMEFRKEVRSGCMQNLDFCYYATRS